MIVVHADIEEWLCAWIRSRSPLLGVTPAWVSNVERPSEAGGPPKAGEVHVVIRDDSGPNRDLMMKDSTVGVTVIGHTRQAMKPTRDVANYLVALIEGEAPIVGSPIADVQVVSGPYSVPSNNDEARLYAVLDVTLVGTQQ